MTGLAPKRESGNNYRRLVGGASSNVPLDLRQEVKTAVARQGRAVQEWPMTDEGDDVHSELDSSTYAQEWPEEERPKRWGVYSPGPWRKYIVTQALDEWSVTRPGQLDGPLDHLDVLQNVIGPAQQRAGLLVSDVKLY